MSERKTKSNPRLDGSVELQMSFPGPQLLLCLTRQEFEEVARRYPQLVSEDIDDAWVECGAGRTYVTVDENTQGRLVCVVCIDSTNQRDPICGLGLLAHEAWHVCEAYFEAIGAKPDSEIVAYALQSTFTALLQMYESTKFRWIPLQYHTQEFQEEVHQLGQ